MKDLEQKLLTGNVHINPKSRLIIYCNLSTFEEITCVCNAVVSVSEGFTIYMFNDASIMLIEIGVFKTHKIVHVNLGGRGYHPSSNDPIKQNFLNIKVLKSLQGILCPDLLFAL